MHATGQIQDAGTDAPDDPSTIQATQPSAKQQQTPQDNKIDFQKLRPNKTLMEDLVGEQLESQEAISPHTGTTVDWVMCLLQLFGPWQQSPCSENDC